MLNSWSSEEEEKLSTYLVERVCNNIKGVNNEYCVNNYPRDKYFIGNLRPRPEVEEETGFFRELISKLSPVSFGAEFKLSGKEREFKIKCILNWNCYYRVFPDYNDQKDLQRSPISKEKQNREARKSEPSLFDGDELDDSNHDELDESNDREELFIYSKDDLQLKFKKVECSVLSVFNIFKDSNDVWICDVDEFRKKTQEKIEEVLELISKDSNRLRTNSDEDEKIKVDPKFLESEEEYNQFLRSLKKEILPSWKWDINVEIRSQSRKKEPESIIVFEFTNSSMKQDNSNIESYFFNTSAVFELEQEAVVPFTIELAPKNFRYNRYVWGRGFNCNIKSEKNRKGLITLTTISNPIHSQKRYVTQQKPEAKFLDLAGNPIPYLKKIYDEMVKYLGVWDEEAKKIQVVREEWEKYGNEFQKDRTEFENEIKRFRKGLEILEHDNDAKYAFILLNKTFSKVGKNKGYDGWRLFQIVFIVTQIPGIYSLSSDDENLRKERKKVDIVYFPTGGGKTEAYLGTIIYHVFYDRLRGKVGGVTAWTRFPLRLLTLQQTQRIADVIGNAELVRLNEKDGRLSGTDIDEFSVGYFVGKGGSPNEIINPEVYRYSSAEHEVIWSYCIDPNIRQKWKRITKCPSCNTESISIEFDSNKNRLIHKCENKGCEFKDGRIPIYIVDNEIYRYLPTVLVGTIDKLAGLGNQRKFAQLLGKVDKFCPVHGYAKIECCQKDCVVEKLEGISKNITGPDLFIQDELHLLKEGLGTFDAHYETFTQKLLQEYGKKAPVKIIASSATIELFERQVQHLYGRSKADARVFPGPGPNLRESFYAYTKEYPQRIFVGILPHNKTIFNAILELIEEYISEVEQLYRLPIGLDNPYGGQVQPGSEEWFYLVDFYLTTLTYFLSNRQLDEIHTDLINHTDPRIRSRFLHGIKMHLLTGGTSTDEVAHTLSVVETQSNIEDDRDTVLATSMVSHGVDVNRFNSMFFYGIPRYNAEYIQASSRVGRSHVGIVFNCFHPARERDRSHYLYFSKFHEYLGQLVEPVAINRWAKYSIDRTLPGLFMASWLQLVSDKFDEQRPGKFYKREYVKRELSRGTLREEDFTPLLLASYIDIDKESLDEEILRAKIISRVRQYFDQLASPGTESDWVSDAFSPYKPMSSLRDVDEQIGIKIDSSGVEWLRKSNDRR